MLNRQRLVLSLVNEAPSRFGSTQLVKLAFLLGRETSISSDPTYYSFLPYKFGPFSFSMYREIEKLQERGLIDQIDGCYALPAETRRSTLREVERLNPEAARAVRSIVNRYGHLERDDLVRSVYRRYRWFTVNTQLPELCDGARQKLPDAPRAVYTAGYHGEMVDGFLDRLLQAGIRTIADVRANPISRKFGFSGKRLRSISEDVGLRYVHLPELGIPSSMRRDLSSSQSYRDLFSEYETDLLPRSVPALKDLADACMRAPTVIVCAESDPRFCHRSPLAARVSSLTQMEVIHLHRECRSQAWSASAS